MIPRFINFLNEAKVHMVGTTKIYEVSTYKQLIVVRDKSRDPEVRGLVSADTAYVWDAYLEIHYKVARALGLIGPNAFASTSWSECYWTWEHVNKEELWYNWQYKHDVGISAKIAKIMNGCPLPPNKVHVYK